MHTAQGGAAAETQRRSGGDSRMRIVQGPGQARSAEAQRRFVRLEARGARPGSAPRRASANPDVLNQIRFCVCSGCTYPPLSVSLSETG